MLIQSERRTARHWRGMSLSTRQAHTQSAAEIAVVISNPLKIEVDEEN